MGLNASADERKDPLRQRQISWQMKEADEIKSRIAKSWKLSRTNFSLHVSMSLLIS